MTPSGTQLDKPSGDKTPQFVQLLLTHQRRIQGYIVTMLANWADAEEVFQETSLVLWEKFDEFTPGTNFGAWACRIAHFQTLKFLQRPGKGQLQFSTDFLERVAEQAERRADELTARQEALAACVEKLSDSDRQLVVGRFQPETTTAALADSAGRSVKAVYKALNRIYDRLFHCVERAIASKERS